MRKLQIADAQVMQVAIRQEIARSEESRYDHRLHGVLLVATGQSANRVAEVFGEDARTVQRWVRRFEASGVRGITRGRAAGPSPIARCSPMAPARARLTAESARARLLAQHLGRAAAERALGPAISNRARCAPVSTVIPANGVSLTQTPTASRSVGPCTGRGRKKNCGASVVARILNCGAWTNATSSSTVPGHECGSLPRFKTPSSCMRRPASRLPVSARSVCARGGSSGRPPRSSMGSLSKLFSKSCCDIALAVSA